MNCIAFTGILKHQQEALDFAPGTQGVLVSPSALAPEHRSGWGVGAGPLVRGLSPQGALLSLLCQRTVTQGGGKESWGGQGPRHLFLDPPLFLGPSSPPLPFLGATENFQTS